jgi:para-nitrobenzyl esterase
VDTESTYFLASDLRNFSVTADQVRARIKDEFAMDDAAAQALMDAYQQAEPGRMPADVLIGIASDSLFRAPIIRGAASKADARQAPVHLYNVAWHAPVDGGIYRAPHTIDIPLAFGNTAASAALTGTGPEQAEVSRNVLSSFVAFARTGNPNNDRVPEWPAYETATRPTMSFDVQCQIVPDLRSGDRVAIGTLQTRSNSGPLHTYR